LQIAPPGQEGWPEGPGWWARISKNLLSLNNHPVCAAIRLLREIFLIAQPPLLARRGDLKRAG
jgi:hypothetical protein